MGEIKVDNSDKITRIVNKFRVSSFNADDYFLVSGQNAYLSPGSLLKKTLWLHEISSNNRLELSFDKLTYMGEDFYNQSIKLLYGQGYLEIKDLKLQSSQTDLIADLTIDISNEDAKFEMKVIADSFHYTALQNNELFGSKSKEIDAYDQFFSLPSLAGFHGRIYFDIKELVVPKSIP